MADGHVYLQVDVSDLQDKIGQLESLMEPERFKQAMYGVFRNTSRHVSKILKQDLPHEYNIKPSPIGKAVKSPKFPIGGMGVGCIIPLEDSRRPIGGSGGFGATGGARGWNAVRNRRKYKIKANILQGKKSELPLKVDETEYPPFRNIGSVLHGKTYARRGNSRGPLVRVMGIAIPQMPMNRSEAEVQADIKTYLEQQIEHRITVAMRLGK